MTAMVKRTACSVAWLMSVAWGFNLANLVIGLPPVIGLLLGGAVAAVVFIDPTHRIWPVPAVGAGRTASDRGHMVPASPTRT
jgi:uncharacterized protein (DUF697 family)